MKGLSELLIIVVTVIVILIAAFVLVTVFGKGTGGVVDTAFTVRATAQCQFRCSFLCGSKTSGAASGSPTGYDSELVVEGDKQFRCSEFVKCDCLKENAGPTTTSRPK